MEWGWLFYAILQCGHYIMPYGETSERQSDSKVQTEITPEVGVDDREMAAAFQCGRLPGANKPGMAALSRIAARLNGVPVPLAI